jgi:putative membrane protein
MRNLLLTATALALTASAWLPGWGQDQIPPPITAEEKSAFENLTDEQFAEKAAQINLMESALGAHAAVKAERANIQQFGKQLQDDHKKANHQLQMITKKRGMNSPSKLDTKHQAKVDKLLAPQGEEFDRGYLKHIMEGHRFALLLYQHESQSGKVDELKAYATQILPTVREHHQKAEKLWRDNFASVR